MTTSDRRNELLVEINYRMKGAGEETLRLLNAMSIDDQPINALESWLKYLERAKIQPKGEDYAQA